MAENRYDRNGPGSRLDALMKASAILAIVVVMTILSTVVIGATIVVIMVI